MPADWRSLYPFQSHELRLERLRFHYVDEGQGETLLLVHGNPTWSFYWRNLISAFRDRYRVIAVDHMGCGLSDKPQDYPYRLGQHVENLSQLVRELDLQNATLVGHDWGGAIGLGAALKSPDRFERVVMMNTGAFRCNWMPRRIRVCRTPIFGELAVRGLNAFLRAGFRMATSDLHWLSAAVRAGSAPYDSWANRIAIDRFVNDIPMNSRHPSYNTLLQIEEGLPTLADRPWLLLWGLRDWCFSPWFLERFLEFIPNAEVHRFADAGHWVMEDAVDQIIPIMNCWLSKGRGKSASLSPGSQTGNLL